MKTLTLAIALLCIALPKANSQLLSKAEKDSLIKIGMIYFEKSEEVYFESLDSSLYYTELAQPYFKKAEDWENYVNCFSGALSIYHKKRNFERYEHYCKLAMESAEKYLKPEDDAYSYVLSNMALLNRQKGNYDRTIELYNEALDINRNSGNQKYIASQHFNIASAYWYKGDFDVSIDYFHKTLALNVQETLRPNIYSVLGKCYSEKNELDSALFYYQKSLDAIPEKMKSASFGIRRKINGYQYIAELYLNKKEFDNCEAYILKALDLQKGPKPYNKGFSFNLLGKLLQKKKDYSGALKNFNKALEIATEEFQHLEKSRDISICHIAIAAVHHDKKDYQQALQSYQQALIALAQGFEDQDVYSNPTTEQFISKIEAMNLLKKKAQLFYTKYQDQKVEKDLMAAEASYQQSVKLIQLIRHSHLSEGSKQLLAENTASIYEGAIEVAVALHQKTGDEKYLANAFALAENNKAILLLESINANTAKGFANLPDSLLQKEQELKIDITFYEQQLSLEQQRSVNRDAEKVKAYENRLFDLKQTYNTLIERFEKEFPAYHELKYNTALATVEQVRKDIIGQQEALVEYFVGEEKAWVFLITSGQLQVVAIDQLEQLPTLIAELRSIIDTAPDGRDAKADYQQFSEASFALHQQLMKAVEQHLPSDINKLYIIADHQLNYIPFEILIRQAAPTDGISYSPAKLHYLFEDFAISYDYSATLLRKNRLTPSSKASSNFIGFAPSFGTGGASADSRNCNEEGLYSLQCSQNEVESIAQLIGGATLSALTASKEAFKKQAANHRIIHLATHACINELDPMLNRIYLANDFISNYDLYNLQLNADLAVLSACNTGSGKLVRGEGVMSLSRGFIHAGCPSTLMSLWSVDDCATSQIMLGFYEQLSEGMSKDKAMHQARLNYLSTSDKAHKHPYYWSAFVQFGNPEALQLSNSGSKWWFFALGFVLLLGIGWWRRNS